MYHHKRIASDIKLKTHLVWYLVCLLKVDHEWQTLSSPQDVGHPDVSVGQVLCMQRYTSLQRCRDRHQQLLTAPPGQ
jgi:hypothetical protein